MNRDELENFLHESLSDLVLSRGERRTLKAMAGPTRLNANDRAFLRHRAFAIANASMPSAEARLVVEWLEDVSKVLAPTQQDEPNPTKVFFSPGGACRDAIIRQLDAAERTADICVFTITDNTISDRIVSCRRRGVDVRIITDNDKAEDRGSDVGRLEAQGVAVRVDRTEHHMHHKFAVFDRRTFLSGSYNWTRSAARFNHENLLLSSDPSSVRSFAREFDRLWDALA